MPLINFQLEMLTEGLGNIRDDLQKRITEEALPVFREWANEIARDAIQSNPNQPYTIAVDGKLSSDLFAIGGATKSVLIHFTQNAVMLAVREFAMALQESSYQKQVRWDKMRRGGLHVDIPSSILVFWWKDSIKQLVNITSVGQIDDFQPGDSIMITSSNPWQQYVNTKYQGGPNKAHPSATMIRNKDGSGGFFGMAAKRIRTRLRAGPSSTGRTALWVGAIRSRAILGKIGMPPLKTQAGIENWNKHMHWGAWGIMVKYSSRVALSGLNRS